MEPWVRNTCYIYFIKLRHVGVYPAVVFGSTFAQVTASRFEAEDTGSKKKNIGRAEGEKKVAEVEGKEK